jgi:uncharacterized membrane protein
MQGLTWILVRLVHVLTSVVWVGAAILIARHLMPAVRAAGPGGVAVMKQLTVVQRLPFKLALAAILAIASGGYLLWIDSTGFSPSWLKTGPGITYCFGSIAAFLAAAIGFGINVPTANRMGALAAVVNARPSGVTAEEGKTLEQLASRVAQGTRAVAWLLIVATVAMAIARYVP